VRSCRMAEFTDLPLHAALFQGLDALGHVQMTPIQAQCLPALLEGRDVIAQAPTGSGKTAAFGLGLLHRLDASQIRLQALVLCPTRELADQVSKHIRKLATGIANLKLLTLTGGMPLGPQLASLAHEPHVVVGTPGRVQELLRKQALDLRGVRTLVLDEVGGEVHGADVVTIDKGAPRQRTVQLLEQLTKPTSQPQRAQQHDTQPPRSNEKP